MVATRSNPAVKTKVFAYEDFQGLDTSRDITSLDTGKQQHLTVLENASCDWRGQIVRDPTASLRKNGGIIRHIRFFGRDELAYVEETGAGLNLSSDRDHLLESVYPTNAVVSSTVFNQQAHFAARSLATYRYDGVQFRRNQSPALANLAPAYLNSIQRRFVVAGIPGKETEVHFSRVDQDEIFADDEDPASTNALRAGFIDIANLLGTADQSPALASSSRTGCASSPPTAQSSIESTQTSTTGSSTTTHSSISAAPATTLYATLAQTCSSARGLESTRSSALKTMASSFTATVSPTKWICFTVSFSTQ